MFFIWIKASLTNKYAVSTWTHQMKESPQFLISVSTIKIYLLLRFFCFLILNWYVSFKWNPLFCVLHSVTKKNVFFSCVSCFSYHVPHLHFSNSPQEIHIIVPWSPFPWTNSSFSEFFFKCGREKLDTIFKLRSDQNKIKGNIYFLWFGNYYCWYSLKLHLPLLRPCDAIDTYSVAINQVFFHIYC